MANEFSYFRRPVTSALVAPAVRTVFIRLLSNDAVRCDDCGGAIVSMDILPVVAIRSSVIEIYRGPWSGSYFATPKTLVTLAEDGWVLQRVVTFDNLLVVDPDGDPCLVECDELSFASRCLKSRVVACPWHPEADEAKLGKIVSDLKEMAELEAMEDEGDEVDSSV